MKKLILAAVLLSGATGLWSTATAGEYIAKNCEIFIDKMSSVGAAHGVKFIKVWVKTLNERLDSPVYKVGFKYSVAPKGYANYGNYVEQDMTLEAFFSSKDYFTATLPLYPFSGDMATSVEYRGYFYVQTENGTIYKFKDLYEGNYALNLNVFKQLDSIRGFSTYSDSVEAGIPTQRADMIYYNHNQNTGGYCY